MPRPRSLVAAAAAAALAITLAPGAAAADGPDLAGRWVSDSLRDNRIGYFLVLREAPGRAVGYVGHLRFERQDGSRDRRMPVSATVVGSDVVIAARKGTFDRGGRTVIGRMDGSGTLVMTNCLDRLRQVMSWDLASDCTLRLQR
ncbi:MAG: hypothetical protein ACO21P_04550 [Candidatus Nanopelagicales bacterium]